MTSPFDPHFSAGCNECLKNPNPHTCPYAEEVDEDYESLCLCCNECTYQCADNI